MIALIRLMLAFGSIAGQSPDVACAREIDPAACVETACRVASGLDYSVSECNGLARNLRHKPPVYWRLIAK